jgi:hypothetical protein
MRIGPALTLLFTACILASCTLPTSSESIVTSLRFSPSAFDSFKRNSELRYTLKERSRVSVVIVRRDPAETTIKTLFSGLEETPGSHAHSWLGDNDAGRFAATGEYVAILTAGNERSEATVTVFHY